MQRTPSSRFAVLAACLVLPFLGSGACSGTKAPPDSAAGGSGGGAGGAGGVTGGSGGGSGGSGGAGGSGGRSPAADAAPSPDLAAGGSPGGDGPGRDGPGAADAPVFADVPRVDAAADAGARPDVPAPAPDASPPRDGGGFPSCAVGSACHRLGVEYAEAFQRAKGCTMGAANQCQRKATPALGCQSGVPCWAWVSDVTGLREMATRFFDAGCSPCLPSGDRVDRCHPTLCNSLGEGVCVPGAGGQGTCINRDLTCPAGIMTGSPCSSPEGEVTCQRGPGSYCFCSSGQTSWRCF